jgi:hypothetical protein
MIPGSAWRLANKANRTNSINVIAGIGQKIGRTFNRTATRKRSIWISYVCPEGIENGSRR